MKNYEICVLGGGGAKGIAAIGALYYIYERGWINNIKTYSGCSIGAIVCTLLSVGYTPLEIFAKVCEFNKLAELDFTDILTNFGVLDIKKMTVFVEDLLDVKASRDITFQELKDFYKKELYIVATKYSTKTPVYFSYKTTPNMKLIDAVNMSCNIPLIFKSYEYEGEIYYDGGLCDNLPVDPIIGENRGDAIVIMNNFESSVESKTKDFFSFVTDILSIPITTNSNKSIKLMKNSDTVLKISTTVSTFSFNLNEEKKIEVFKQGYNSAMAAITQ